MGFFSGLFGGSNPTLTGGMGSAGKIAGQTTSQGLGLLNQAGSLVSGLMGGDPAQIAKLFAPQMSTLQQQGQQQKSAMSQFGNRSGGITAKGQTIDDTTRSAVNNMISSLTANAMNTGANLGQSLVQTGMDATKMQVGFSQQQLANWSNSILGQGMAQGIGALESAALS